MNYSCTRKVDEICKGTHEVIAMSCASSLLTIYTRLLVGDAVHEEIVVNMYEVSTDVCCLAVYDSKYD